MPDKTVEPGMVKYKDIDGDGVITPDDRTTIGNGQPDWYGGITNTFNYKNIDFSFMFQFQYGNDVYNATRMFNTQSQDERSNQLAKLPTGGLRHMHLIVCLPPEDM